MAHRCPHKKQCVGPAWGRASTNACPSCANARCTVPGTRVRFLIDNLGAARRNELWATTDERVGIGDEGVVAFEHPNQNLCKGWVYVEVTSKSTGEKLYVGVAPRMIEPVPS